MGQRRTWSQQEDNLLQNLLGMNENRPTQEKFKWNDIAQKINQALPGCRRTGKQCRQRWHNQLDPQIKHSTEWGQHQISILLQQQKLHGNKWAEIAKHLPGRSDNNVKNYFYSTLRRGMRRINNYISVMRKNRTLRKQFNQNLLSKVLAVADRKYKTKLDVKHQQGKTFKLAENIRDTLLKLAFEDPTQQNSKVLSIQRQKQALIDKIIQFNQNCKRKKTKRKVEKEQYLYSQSQIEQDAIEIQPEIEYKQKKKSSQNLHIQHDTKKNKKISKKQSNMSKKSLVEQNQQSIFQEGPITRSKSKVQQKPQLQVDQSINVPSQLFRGISDFFQQGILKGKKSYPQQESLQYKTNLQKNTSSFLRKISSVKKRDSLFSNKQDLQYFPNINLVESMDFAHPIPLTRAKDSMKESFNFMINQYEPQPIRFQRQNSSFREYSTNLKNNKQDQQPSSLIKRRSSLRKKNSFL